MRSRASDAWDLRWKRRLLVAALVVIPVGAAAFVLSWDGPDCPGHWHSTFQVYMDGNRIPFRREVFYDTPNGIHDYHMHADDQIMHFHPQLVDKCVPLDSFMTQLGITVGSDGVSFNEYYGANAGTYQDNQTHHLEVHFQRWGEPWERAAWSDISGHQIKPGDKLLVTYGNLTAEEVEREKASVRDLPVQYFPSGYGPRAGETEAPAANETLYPGSQEVDYTNRTG